MIQGRDAKGILGQSKPKPIQAAMSGITFLLFFHSLEQLLFHDFLFSEVKLKNILSV